MRCVGWPDVPGRTYILSVGKAATPMVTAIQDRLPKKTEGLVVTRRGYAHRGFAADNMRIVEASHPVPDAAGAEAARAALAAADMLGEDDLLLVLMSGGASALLPAPAKGISLAEKQEVTRALLRCGAPIGEMNIVRKHLSAIKGGRLAVRAWPAATHMIAISDIPGDDIAMIGSGPTVRPAPTRSPLHKNIGSPCPWRSVLNWSRRLWKRRNPAIPKCNSRAPKFVQDLPICARPPVWQPESQAMK